MLFSQIIGHDEIKRKLIQSVKENRVSHAQLFLGQGGFGTLPLALAYAQYINCENKGEHDSCGHCHSCLQFEKFMHPDLHFVIPTNTTKKKKEKGTINFLEEWREYLTQCGCYAEEQEWLDFIEIENKLGIIAIEEAQSIIHDLSFKAYEAEYRVVVIWMAERINEVAANTLLKIIEEPPEKTIFLLVADNQENILQTIRSRTVLVKIPRIGDDEIRQALTDKTKCSIGDAEKAVALANGNWKKALNVINESYSDTIQFDLFTRWMRLCFKAALGDIIDFADKDFKPLGRDKQMKFFRYALNIIRNSLLINNNLAEKTYLPEDEMKFAKNFSPFINDKNYIEIAAMFEESISQIERNINASLVFMDNSFKMTKLLRLK